MPNEETTTTTSGIAPGGSGDATFAGRPVFNCPDSDFVKCFQGRKKNKKWKTTLSGETLTRVKEWMNQSYKNKKFIIRNSNGEMMHLQ